MGSEWREMTLGEFVTLQRGHDLPDSQRNPGHVPILGSFGITGWHSEAKTKGPGVTIGRSGGSIGVVSYTPNDYWPLNTALYVKDFHGNDAKFAYYFLKTIDFKSYNSGSAQPSLNRNHIHPLPVKVPSPEIQKVIAGILSGLDYKIALNHQINTTLESMAQALFKSWFVDFDPVIDNALAARNPIPEILQARADARAALGDQRKPLPDHIRQQFPDRFVLTEEMGWVPEGWAVEPIGNLIELAYGKSLPGTKRIDGNVPVYGSGGLSGYHNASLVKGPSVIVGRKGTVGSLYWVEDDCFPIDTVFYVIRKSHLPLSWIFQALQLVDIKSMGADSAVPGVNRNVVYATRLVVPQEEVLTHYSKQIGAIFGRCKALRDENRSLANLRDTLLPKLLSGELRIPEAEKEVEQAI